MNQADADAIDLALKDFYAKMHTPEPPEKFVEPRRCGIKPKASVAFKVHPRQVQEATERAKRHGVPTDYRKDGRPIITSRAHQKALLRMERQTSSAFDKVVNVDAGYGD